jgi:hypothetical protein
VPLQYDVGAVAEAMRAERLPEAFAQSLECGLWTTCYNILPPAERVPANRYSGRAPHASLSKKDPDARHAAPVEGD